MKTNKLLLLLSTELKSTSSINILKYSNDSKKRSKAIGSFIGYGMLVLLILAYGFFSSWGYGFIGLSKIAPTLTALSVSVLAFFFTLLKSNSYLYEFKEYDMLMSMPFEIKDIVGSKFLYMYIKSMHWYLCISFSGLIGYAIWEKPGIYTYHSWILLTFILPIIPSVVAAAFGTLIVSIGVRFKHKKVVQVILSFALILFSFSLRYIIEGIAKSGKTEQILTDIANGTQNVAGWYFPADWFTKAVTGENVFFGILLILLCITLSYGFFVLVAKSYRRINSKLFTGTTQKKKGEISYKQQSIVVSIAHKELRRLLGSSLYMTNCGFGQVMALIIGIAALFVNADTIIATITGGAPIEAKTFGGALPLIAFFFVGMAPTTCCSLSLEGKNNWIVQSLPIRKWDLYKGKMLMNLIISIPFMLLPVLGLCICFRVGVISTLLSLILSVIICIYTTVFGMFTGIKFVKYEWENEIEVIKQGAALAVYLFPNMILTMGLCVGTVALGFVISSTLILLMLNALYIVLSLIFYLLVKKGCS